MTTQESPSKIEAKRSEAPILKKFLRTCRGLVDACAVSIKLTQDLRNFIYYVPDKKGVSLPPQESVEPVNESDKEGDVVNDKTPENKQPSSDHQLIGSVGKRKLDELNSDISDSEAREGFRNPDTGEIIYIIEKVVEYDPKKGYLVHWKGWGKGDRTWQTADDMPESLTRAMKKARKQYERNVDADKRWEQRRRESV